MRDYAVEENGAASPRPTRASSATACLPGPAPTRTSTATTCSRAAQGLPLGSVSRALAQAQAPAQRLRSSITSSDDAVNLTADDEMDVSTTPVEEDDDAASSASGDEAFGDDLISPADLAVRPMEPGQQYLTVAEVLGISYHLAAF